MKTLSDFIVKEKVFLAISLLALSITGSIIYTQFKSLHTKPVLQSVKGFPEIPIYPKAKLIDSASDPKEGAMYFGIRYSETWESNDKVPVISKWYVEQMKKAGWTIDSLPANPEAGDVQLINVTNTDYSLNLSLIKNKDNDKTKIIAEFAGNYQVFCENRYGKSCR